MAEREIRTNSVVRLSFGTSLFAATLGAYALGQQPATDSCRAVLEPHLRNVLTLQRQVSSSRASNAAQQSSFIAAVQQWMCSHRGGTSASREGGGVSLGVPIDGIPIEFGGNLSSSESEAWYDQYCSSGGQSSQSRTASRSAKSLSYEQASYTAASLVPADAISAWKECMVGKMKDENRTNSRISLEPHKNGHSVSLSLRWRPDGLRPDAPIVKEFIPVSASCINPPQPGSTLLDSQIIVCTRQGDGPVIFALNTTQGAAEAELPAIQYRVENLSGEEIVIPQGTFKELVIKVSDEDGNPVQSAHVAWQVPSAPQVLYISLTGTDGTTKATNLYRYGTYEQRATLVSSSTSVGFVDPAKLTPAGPSVTIIVHMKEQRQ